MAEGTGDGAGKKAGKREPTLEECIRLTNEFRMARPENAPERTPAGRRPLSENFDRAAKTRMPANPPVAAPENPWPSEAEILQKARERAAEQLGKKR